MRYLYAWPPEEYTPSIEYQCYAEVYDLLYGGKTDDFEFYSNYARKCGDPILELGCGTGRVTCFLAETGYEITGVDNNPSMLSRGHWYSLPPEIRSKIKIVYGDMCSFELNRYDYSLTIIPFAAFLHLHTDTQRLNCFRAIYKHLKDKGTVLLDMDDVIGLRWANSKRSSELYILHEVREPATGLTVKLQASYVHDTLRQIVVRYDIIDWVDRDIVIKRMIIPVSLRYAEAESIIELLREANFKTVESFRDYRNTPYRINQPELGDRLILVAHKSE